MTTQDEAVRQLSEYRRSIDNFDAALIHILAERFRCTKAVGRLKATNDLPPGDPERENTRSNGCANWPAMPISIRTSPRLS